MTTRRLVIAAVACCLTIWGGTGPAAASVIAQADAIMRLNSLDFIHHPHVEPFDWSNDGCTYWPDGVFHRACAQHDFGYRNYGRHGALQLSPTQETKNWIDENFWHQMRHICLTEVPAGAHQQLCLGEAHTMYMGLVGGVADHAFF